jgi:hypothetical protein
MGLDRANPAVFLGKTVRRARATPSNFAGIIRSVWFKASQYPSIPPNKVHLLDF